MKSYLSILLFIGVSLNALAQFPPILRQSLTTNTANNPTAAGQTPVWNGTTWLMLSTNLTGGGGDTLWTNTATEYLPRLTNSFGFAKGGGGLWLGTNATNNWGPLGPSDSLVAIRDAVNGESANQFFTFLVRGTVTNATSVDGVLTGTQSILSSQATNDLNGVTYAQISAQTDGVAFMGLGSAGTTHTYLADAGNSYLNGTGARLGIGNSSPSAPLHVTGTSFLQGGITNWGGHQHTNGAFVNAVFVSSTANGDAIWSTNLGTVVVTNLYVTNINGVGAGAFTNILWTNSGVVLHQTGSGGIPQLALRFGTNTTGTGISGMDVSTYWNLTNVGVNTIGFGSNILVESRDSAVLSGYRNEIIGDSSSAFAFNVISGGATNYMTNGTFNVIAGGNRNFMSDAARWSTLGGGFDNRVNAGSDLATIAGGGQNRVDTDSSTVVGGQVNTIAGSTGYSFIGAGQNNAVTGDWDTLGGGSGNGIIGNYSFLGGGFQNAIRGTSSEYCTISGGNQNIIGASPSSPATNAFIGGGNGNLIQTRSTSAALAGGAGNLIAAGNEYTFIGGGLENGIGEVLNDSGDYSAIVGGVRNLIYDVGMYAFIGGGRTNWIQIAGHQSVIAGGYNNLLTNGNSFIGGGLGNTNGGGGSVVVGGVANQIYTATNATIGGGLLNYIDTGGVLGVIPGGSSNRVTAAYAWVLGNRTTNALAGSLAIGFPGVDSTELTKSTFTSTNTIIRTSLATAPDTVVTLAADNQVVDITKRSYIRIQSDSAVAGDRTFVLTGTNVAAGARITLEWVGTNAGELVDDAAMSGAGNQRMSATWTPTQYDSVSFIFNGTDAIETARSTN